MASQQLCTQARGPGQEPAPRVTRGSHLNGSFVGWTGPRSPGAGSPLQPVPGEPGVLKACPHLGHLPAGGPEPGCTGPAVAVATALPGEERSTWRPEAASPGNQGGLGAGPGRGLTAGPGAAVAGAPPGGRAKAGLAPRALCARAPLRVSVLLWAALLYGCSSVLEGSPKAVPGS